MIKIAPEKYVRGLYTYLLTKNPQTKTTIPPTAFSITLTRARPVFALRLAHLLLPSQSQVLPEQSLIHQNRANGGIRTQHKKIYINIKDFCQWPKVHLLHQYHTEHEDFKYRRDISRTNSVLHTWPQYTRSTSQLFNLLISFTLTVKFKAHLKQNYSSLNIFLQCFQLQRKYKSSGFMLS